jgi:hypothetical protein
VQATATVDGFDVSLNGSVQAGTESTVTMSVSRNGQPVTNLEPYLGALGHLVALRSNDLAYLHVHPLDNANATNGPNVAFAVHVPSAGAYRLFFDFSHNGTVRTAAFTINVAEAGSPTSGCDGHDGH